MIKITLISFVVIVAMIFTAETKIDFYPFKVSFGKPWFAIGIALIGFGVGFVRYQGYKDGAKNSIDTTFRYLNQLIKKEA